MLLKLIKIVHDSFLMLHLCIFLLCLCLEVVVFFFLSALKWVGAYVARLAVLH